MKQIIILVVLLFLSCAKKQPSKDTLVIISPHWEGVRKEFTLAFKEWYRAKFNKNVNIDWLDQGGSADNLRFIKSEFSKTPDKIGIDIFFGGGIEPHLELKKCGYLEPYRLPEELLRYIPAEISGMPVYDPEYNWYGACLAGFGIIYNKVILKTENLPEPHTWEDLAKPALFGWVGAADPRHSGSMHMMYEIILQCYGWEKGFDIITKLAANTKIFTKSASQIPKDVTLGNIAYGLAIDVYGWAQVQEAGEDKVGFIIPAGLTVINPDAISILKGASNVHLARHFVEFVMSESGQKLWMLDKGTEKGPKEFVLNRLSVLPKLYNELKGQTLIKINPFEFKGTFKYNPDKAAIRYTILNDLIGAIIIDTHAELKAAWEKIIKKGLPAKMNNELIKLPVTEKEVLHMAHTMWKDPKYRNEMISKWVKFAQKKYASIK